MSMFFALVRKEGRKEVEEEGGEEGGVSGHRLLTD